MMHSRLSCPQPRRARSSESGLAPLLPSCVTHPIGGGVEMFGRLQNIYAQTFQIIPLLVVACIWYLFITSLLTIGQGYLEAYFGKGFGEKEAEAAEKRAARAAARPRRVRRQPSGWARSRTTASAPPLAWLAVTSGWNLSRPPSRGRSNK